VSHSTWEDSDCRVMLYGLFHLAEDGPTVRDTARALGMSESLLYKILTGERPPAPELFPALFNITGKLDIINWFVARCKGLALIDTAAAETNGDIRDEIEALVVEVGRVAERRKAAYADGRITGLERKGMLDAAQELFTTAKQLIEEIKEIGCED